MIRTVLNTMRKTAQGVQKKRRYSVTGDGFEGRRIMETSLDRRGFLKTFAIGSAAAMVAGAGLAGCAPQQKGSASATTVSGAGLPEKWDEECEVLVIGSGYAGLAAAYEASKAGADTMVVEKMPTTGGNSAIADGDFAVCMSSAQKAKGIEDSVDKYVADMMAAGLGLNDEEKCRVLAEKSNETWEWTQSDLGVEWDTDEEGNINVIPYGGHNTVRTIHPKIGHGSAMTVPLTEKLNEMGVPMKTGRMVTKFFRDETGRMVGVQVNEKARRSKANRPSSSRRRRASSSLAAVSEKTSPGAPSTIRASVKPSIAPTRMAQRQKRSRRP